MHVGHEKIANIEDQVARSPITDSHLLASAKAIKNRNPNAEEWDSEPIRSLPPMRVGHD